MPGKLKVYLDTSAVSHLDQRDAPEKMGDTLRFWARAERGDFDMCLSQTTLDEVERCPEPKRGVLRGHLEDIAYELLPIGAPEVALGRRIIAAGILPPRSVNDSLHIAAALIGGCDCLVSWNFKHLANVKTVKGVREIAALEGYGGIDIVPPTMLLEAGE